MDVVSVCQALNFNDGEVRLASEKGFKQCFGVQMHNRTVIYNPASQTRLCPEPICALMSARPVAS